MPSIEALGQFPVQLNRCTIRFFDTAVSADIDQLQKAAAGPNVSRYMFDGAPSVFKDAASWMKDKTREAAAEQIAACPPGQRVGLKGLCIEIDGRVSGTISYSYDGDLGHRTIALGYWLAEDSWGRGYATECARWLVDFIVREEPVAVRLVSAVMTPNFASRRVLEKCGFTCEAVMRASMAKGDALVYDAFLMALVIEERLRSGVQYITAE